MPTVVELVSEDEDQCQTCQRYDRGIMGRANTNSWCIRHFFQLQTGRERGSLYEDSRVYVVEKGFRECFYCRQNYAQLSSHSGFPPIVLSPRGRGESGQPTSQSSFLSHVNFVVTRGKSRTVLSLLTLLLPTKPPRPVKFTR